MAQLHSYLLGSDADHDYSSVVDFSALSLPLTSELTTNGHALLVPARLDEAAVTGLAPGAIVDFYRQPPESSEWPTFFLHATSATTVREVFDALRAHFEGLFSDGWDTRYTQFSGFGIGRNAAGRLEASACWDS